MANIYAADFGDVVKHAVLCEVLVREQPARYLESHGGRLDYDLADVEPSPGGIWDFIELSVEFDSLAASTFSGIVRDLAGQPEHPGRYPGSIAFADALLPPDAEVVAFELIAASASSLLEGLAERGRSAQVNVADGLRGVCELARPGDLVFLDPFQVHERGEEFTSAEAFVALANRGVRTVLWYAIHEPTDSAGWIAEAIEDLPGTVWQARLIGDTTEAGLAGCGFLAAHLSPVTVVAATKIVQDLAGALAVVRPGLRLE